MFWDETVQVFFLGFNVFIHSFGHLENILYYPIYNIRHSFKYWGLSVEQSQVAGLLELSSVGGDGIDR